MQNTLVLLRANAVAGSWFHCKKIKSTTLPRLRVGGWENNLSKTPNQLVQRGLSRQVSNCRNWRIGRRARGARGDVPIDAGRYRHGLCPGDAFGPWARQRARGNSQSLYAYGGQNRGRRGLSQSKRTACMSA